MSRGEAGKVVDENENIFISANSFRKRRSGHGLIQGTKDLLGKISNWWKERGVKDYRQVSVGDFQGKLLFAVRDSYLSHASSSSNIQDEGDFVLLLYRNFQGSRVV
jgi:hypothetical protein